MERYRANWPLLDGRTGTQYAVGDVVPGDFPGLVTLEANGGVTVELVTDPAPSPPAPTAASTVEEIPEPPAPTTGTQSS